MISYYDLLGMIKEGNIPKKVKHKDRVYEWTENSYYYNDDYLDALLNMFDDKDMFENNIEIIEEYKYLEKIDTESRTLTMLQLEIIHKINELVVKINELERGLKNERN